MHALLLKLLKWTFGGLIAQVLVGAGITLFGYGAMIGLMQYALNQVAGALGGVSGDVLDILLLGGLGESLTIVGSAMVTRVSLLAGIAGLARIQDIQGG